LNSAYGPSVGTVDPTPCAAVSPKFVVMRPGSMIATSTPKPLTSKRRASEIASTEYLVAW